jgi:hypothetical protein
MILFGLRSQHFSEITGAQGQGVSRIFAPERQEVTAGCRKLYNEEHHNLCSSQILRDSSNQEG